MEATRAEIIAAIRMRARWYSEELGELKHEAALSVAYLESLDADEEEIVKAVRR